MNVLASLVRFLNEAYYPEYRRGGEESERYKLVGGGIDGDMFRVLVHNILDDCENSVVKK